MNVKEAVAIAKRHLSDLFAEEGIHDLGLEEVEFDEAGDVWSVTLGFSRPWDRALGAAATVLRPARAYKVVRMANSDGRILSVRNRELIAAH
ncbi:MAG TPA: hypothetical protein VGJ08_11180 [Rhizomicrobium sp.]|jgi:hypothetical protein